MLNKNVYIIYPAGYHGSYVKWAIEVSDADNAAVPRDPINRTVGTTYGGVGTAHGHHRTPTHQAMHLHEIWMIYNRPTDNRVYLINSMQDDDAVAGSVARLLLQDPTGIVINIHDNTNDDWASYGRINCVTKWPVYMAAVGKPFWCHDQFDPFDCATDRLFRNHLVRNPGLLARCRRPNEKHIQHHLDSYDRWYRVRNKYNAHEVNHETYPVTPSMQNRFFAVWMKNILAPDFANYLRRLLDLTGILDTVDCGPVHDIHTQYLDAQPNLAWFDSVAQWRETGDLDRYLQSHSVIESEILSLILKEWRHNPCQLQNRDVAWQTMSLIEINNLHQRSRSLGS